MELLAASGTLLHKPLQVDVQDGGLLLKDQEKSDESSEAAVISCHLVLLPAARQKEVLNSGDG